MLKRRSSWRDYCSLDPKLSLAYELADQLVRAHLNLEIQDTEW
jgi:hypothetical protein